MPAADKQPIETSLIKLECWIEEHHYKGYEPFDGLSSSLRFLTCNNQLAEQILQQLIRHCPFHIRPLLCVKPLESTKGMGYIAWGYLNMLQTTGNKQYREKAITCLDWLDKNRSPLYDKHSWGNHFDYASRGGRLPKYEPTIVWTSLIGQVFLDAYEILQDEKYLAIAESICAWILSIPREKTDNGTCLSYVGYGQSSIHNSNMLGAAMLARASQHIQDTGYLTVAKEAMAYSCADQLPNGAWYYGKDSKYHWVDNFHTGYNLDSLKRYIEYSGDETFKENLTLGFTYFKNHFFEDSGRPKYYYNRAYPIDIQCASQAIDTLLFFSDLDPSCLDLAYKVAAWTIKNMQHKSGYFIYRILPFKKVKIPMIHWGQATMYRALTYLLQKLDT